MNFILIFLIILVLAVLLMVIFARQEAKIYNTKTSEELVGIAKTVFDRTLKKQANLDKIMSLLASRAELSNAEIRQALKVSSRTAVRYLDELEKQGKVEQIGKTGQTVIYRLKN